MLCLFLLIFLWGFSLQFLLYYIYIYGVFLVEFVFWGFDFHCAFWLVLNMEGFFFPLPTCRFQMGKKKKKSWFRVCLHIQQSLRPLLNAAWEVCPAMQELTFQLLQR